VTRLIIWRHGRTEYNVTGRTQDVTYDDGTGARKTASAQTVVPMIGQRLNMDWDVLGVVIGVPANWLLHAIVWLTHAPL